MAQCEVGSPSFHISQLTDSALVSRICSPFIETEINSDAFCLSLLKQTLLPRIKDKIKEIDTESFKFIPQMTKLTVDNFGQEGLNIISSSVLSEIVNCIHLSGTKYTQIYIDLYVDTAKSISSQYRNEFVSKQIKSLAVSNESKDRMLAANLIPIVSDQELIVPQFHTLSLDRVDSVRAALVKILPACNLDEKVINYVLTNAAGDSSQEVKEKVAEVFGVIAPKNLDLFAKVLNDSSVGRFAVRSIPQIAQANGPEQIDTIFKVAAENYPVEAGAALFDIVKSTSPAEHPILVNFTKYLIKNTTFVWHLYELSQYFENKEPFFEFLSPARAKDWRLRYALQIQTKYFIPIFGARLLNYVLRYSGDFVAIIRDGSAPLWAAMIDLDKSVVDKLLWLSTKGFKARIIVAKAITIYGIKPKFMELAKALAEDPVSNVRFCLASRLAEQKDKDLFLELFGNNHSDPDIRALKFV